MKRQESFCTVRGNVSWCSPYGNSIEVHQKLKIELPYDLAVSLWGIYLKETLTWKPMFTAAIFVQLTGCVWLFATPWTAACQVPQSFTISQSLLKFMSTELVMLSIYLIRHCPLLLLPSAFPSIRVFPMSRLFTSGGQSIGALATVLPRNIQGWFPLGLTDLISLQSKGLSRVFSSTTTQKHQFFGAQPSLWFDSNIHTWLLEKP